MRFARLIIAAAVAGWFAPRTAAGADSTPAPVSDDRIVLSVNGSTLPGTNGGGGGSMGWVHNFNAGHLAGIAVENQGPSAAQGPLGSAHGSLTRDLGVVGVSFYYEALPG